MHGSLSLTLSVSGDRTRPTRVVAVPPLQCSRVRYDDPARPEMACLTLLHLGGVLQGDQLALDISLGPGAAARLTSAAATQVYRMPERAAAQATAITLERGALLVYQPEPTILFAGARFSQATRVVLHEGALLAWCDVLVGGRLARGEVHRYERYGAQLEVYDGGGRCLLAERATLEPELARPDQPGVQDGWPVCGSLYLLALGRDPARPLARAWQALGQHPQIMAGAGALPNGSGILVRALGATAQGVSAALGQVLREALEAF